MHHSNNNINQYTMKKYKFIIPSLLLAGAMLTTTGCQDDFAETNSMKDAVNTGEPAYLFAQAVLDFEPSNYQYWFFNAADFYNCTQMSVPTGSVTESVTEGSAQQGYKSIDVLIGRVRTKIEENTKKPKYILSIRGVGYKLVNQ